MFFYLVCNISFNSPNLLRKVQTINFTNYDEDIDYYNPELHVLKNLSGSTKVISNNDVMKNGEKSNCESGNERKMNMDDNNSGLDDSNVNSDDELLKTVGASKSNDIDRSKNVDDEDWFGPFFLQKYVHWVSTNHLIKLCCNLVLIVELFIIFQSISGSNWMNVLATGDANGVFYEKLFIPENNQFKKENCVSNLIYFKLLK